MKNTDFKFIMTLLFMVLYKRGLKNFFLKLFDLFFVDYKYKTKTFVRNNNYKINYVPYYTLIFKKNIKKLREIIPFKNTYFIDLGCGKGRMLLSSSELEFEKIIGIEKDNKLFEECKKNIIRNNLQKKIKLLNENFNKIKINIPTKKNLIFFWYGSASKHILKKIILNYKKNLIIKIFFFILFQIKMSLKIRKLKYYIISKTLKTTKQEIVKLLL